MITQVDQPSSAEYPASQITSVQLKPAGPLINGFIQFSIPGGTERRSKFGSQTHDAVRDENSVVFLKKHQQAFEQLRDAIESAIVALHSPAPATTPVAGLSNQLAQLAELRASGDLSESEFLTAKKALLQG